MLRHAGPVLAMLVLVGCSSGGDRQADAAPAADTAADVAPDTAAAADVVAASLGGKLVGDPAQLDFGVFYLGCPWASRTVVVSNQGPGPTGELLLTIDKPFRVGPDECSARALLVGEKCQIELRVSPEQAGELAGKLQVWSSKTDLVEVKLKVVTADVVPAFLVSPAALEFAPVALGQSATQKVTVSVPDGFRPVPRVTASVAGPDFAIGKDGCAGVALQPGRSCDLEIAFHPTTAGDRSAALSLSAPEPCPPFQSQVSLRGKGQ